MAASLTPPSLTECGICLSQFKDPKLLPCSHTYCLTCLEDLTKTQIRGCIRCPECRKNIQVCYYRLSNTEIISLPIYLSLTVRISIILNAISGIQERSAFQVLLIKPMDGQIPGKSTMTLWLWCMVKCIFHNHRSIIIK